ncbi:hypothetical protein QTP88_024317 [Uroleucon formosanum]
MDEDAYYEYIGKAKLRKRILENGFPERNLRVQTSAGCSRKYSMLYIPTDNREYLDPHIIANVFRTPSASIAANPYDITIMYIGYLM